MLERLQNEHGILNKRINKIEVEIQQGKDYIWQNKADLDGAEKAAKRMMIHQTIDSGEQAVISLSQIERLIESPCFGRVDFVATDLDIDHVKISASDIQESFDLFINLPLKERIEQAANSLSIRTPRRPWRLSNPFF